MYLDEVVNNEPLHQDLRYLQIIEIQSTLVISKSKGPSETLRHIRISTYQICIMGENTNRTTKFHK